MGRRGLREKETSDVLKALCLLQRTIIIIMALIKNAELWSSRSTGANLALFIDKSEPGFLTLCCFSLLPSIFFFLFSSSQMVSGHQDGDGRLALPTLQHGIPLGSPFLPHTHLPSYLTSSALDREGPGGPAGSHNPLLQHMVLLEQGHSPVGECVLSPPSPPPHLLLVWTLSH